jgi:carbon monoxide dehydrogenase subunit G
VKISDQGQFAVQTTLDRLMPLITNPEFMAQALPDVKEYKVEGPDRASLRMAVGVSHVRGVLPARFRLDQSGGPGKLAVIADASGMGSRIDLKLDFSLSEKDSSVIVEWSSNADVNGLLASVGAGLLRPLTRTKFDAVVSSVQAALNKASNTGNGAS